MNDNADRNQHQGRHRHKDDRREQRSKQQTQPECGSRQPEGLPTAVHLPHLCKQYRRNEYKRCASDENYFFRRLLISRSVARRIRNNTKWMMAYMTIMAGSIRISSSDSEPSP